VNGQKPWIQAILRNRGVDTGLNCGGPIPFSEVLVFADMHDEGKIVEIANQPVRDGFEEKKRALVEKITRLTYESMN
jgi:hypothetical protein